MKKSGILNSHISKMAADLGHTDMFCVSDCGLPTFDVNKIDLAVKFGTPSLIDITNLVNEHIEIETIVIAKEMSGANNNLYNQILEIFKDKEIIMIEHNAFKKKLKECKTIIRTGENTPYANIIFKSGVVFK